MKTSGKIIGRLAVGCVLAGCLSRFTPQTFAIEGLQISVPATNAVLSWPSDPSETFIVQYRNTLNATDSWATLTNYLPADSSTNFTSFVDPNPVQYGSITGGGTNSGGGGGGIPLPDETNSVSDTNGMIVTPGLGFYRVVRDGVHLWGITNGMVLHDELITPIEFSVDSTDQVVGITFYDTNNSPIIGASAQPNGSGWLLVWNTTMSYNGDYNIYAELNFASDSSAISVPVSVTVSNVISFPNYFSQVFGDQMWIYAQTIPNAGYEIDLYDENTNYLGSFNDYADADGTVSFTWDLTDGNGNTFDSTNFFGVFTVTNSSSSNIRSALTAQSGSVADFQTASPARKSFSAKVAAKGGGIHPNDVNSIASSKQMWVKEGRWTPNNNWVVAYAPLTDPSTDPNTSYKESLMMLGGPDGNDGGVIGTLDGNDFHGTLSPGNVPQTSAFELADTNSRAQLLSYLASSTYENFYYFGHGNDSAISAYNSAATGITSQQIAFALGNVPLSFSGPPELINIDPPIMVYPTINPSIRRVALHPYRFVFLDGCETGTGNFCEAFGIPAVTVNTNFFAAAGVEPRAFLGYTQEISFNTAQWDWRAFMIGGFLADWEGNNLDLQSCVGNAQNAIYSEGFQPMDSSAVIYGGV